MNTRNIPKGLNQQVFDPNNPEQVQATASGAGFSNVEVPDDAGVPPAGEPMPQGRNIAIGGNVQRQVQPAPTQQAPPPSQYPTGSRRGQYLESLRSQQPQQQALTPAQLFNQMNGGQVPTAGQDQQVSPGQDQAIQQNAQQPQAQQNGAPVDWQALARQNQSEKDKLAHQVNMLQSQVSLLMANGSPNQTQQQQEPAKSMKPPTLEDFVDDDWEGDVTDKGFLKYQEARDEYVAKSAEMAAVNAVTRSQRESKTLEEAQQFANAFPEFKNPDGSANIQMIQNYFNQVKGMGLVGLKRAIDGVNGVQPAYDSSQPSYMTNSMETPQGLQQGQQVDPQQYLNEQIYQQDLSASPSVVAGGSPGNPAENQEQLPQNFQQAFNVFGDMEIPPDFGGIVR